MLKAMYETWWLGGGEAGGFGVHLNLGAAPAKLLEGWRLEAWMFVGRLLGSSCKAGSCRRFVYLEAEGCDAGGSWEAPGRLKACCLLPLSSMPHILFACVYSLRA